LSRTHNRDTGKGREKLSNVTFLEAYNCDSAGSPKPGWADRAQKQLYRADYVLYHFVHYATVTKGMLGTYIEHEGQKKWQQRLQEKAPSQRITDEIHEAVMVHTKGADSTLTRNYKKRCNYQFDLKWRGCYVGFPWPNDTDVPGAHDEEGMEYNCFINRKVENYWLPRLRERLL
jgi:hypothetical protein